jgi:hypothetical protein
VSLEAFAAVMRTRPVCAPRVSVRASFVMSEVVNWKRALRCYLTVERHCPDSSATGEENPLKCWQQKDLGIWGSDTSDRGDWDRLPGRDTRLIKCLC